jgi:type IV pilus assembly protein PilY1
MYVSDMRPSLAGLQNVSTLHDRLRPGGQRSTLLQNTAAGAGGVFYEASDTATLTTVLTNIVRHDPRLQYVFHRTCSVGQRLQPDAEPERPLRHRLQAERDLRLAGQHQEVQPRPGRHDHGRERCPAVEITTGFFRTTAQSFWSTGVDGDRVTRGGAANELPAPASRNVYSDLNTASALTAAANTVVTTNAAITTAMLGLGAAEAPGRDPLINWVRGADIDDENANGSTVDARLEMGDPMNGRPATVIYGGTVANPNPDDGVVYAVTNEGYLQAIDARTATSCGLHAEAIARAGAQSVQQRRDHDRTYGLDANIRVVKNEVNENGVIEPALGETVRIYFGMRRGGRDYFGLDVTNRNAPTLLFRIGPNEAGAKLLTGAGQSWSTPTVARVNISGATQNTQQQVLVFGGGYDAVQDNGAYAIDASGNEIFMVDAVSGNVLWYAGPSTDASADRRLASMIHGIPGDIRIFDMTGDGYADRMYAGDMGGRVWRFDINNGQTRANLVTGGVFASLGNAHLTTHPAATTRRFYSAPDVAFLSQGGRTWLNIAIGSGYRGHPLNTQTQDRFYSLRDHQPFARLTQAQYDAATVITEADPNLIDITTDIAPTIPIGASGWRLDPAPSGRRLHGREIAFRGAHDPEHDPVHDVRAQWRRGREYVLHAWLRHQSALHDQRVHRCAGLQPRGPGRSAGFSGRSRHGAVAGWHRTGGRVALPQPGKSDDLRRRRVPS